MVHMQVRRDTHDIAKVGKNVEGKWRHSGLEDTSASVAAAVSRIKFVDHQNKSMALLYMPRVADAFTSTLYLLSSYFNVLVAALFPLILPDSTQSSYHKPLMEQADNMNHNAMANRVGSFQAVPSFDFYILVWS